MPTYRGGRHEHGQNFLTDPTTTSRIIGLVAQTQGPIIEIGPGRGALTFGLHALGRPLTAVEIDHRHARWLSTRLRDEVRVVHADFLRWPLPATPHVLVGSLPFHHTTAVLRKALHTPACTHAVLLVQWEVARRRAAIGGASMMTAQWWPWTTFTLDRRVPATAFQPRPSVDGGLLTITRRPNPLLPPHLRDRYRTFVHTVFTSKGAGLPAILATACHPNTRKAVHNWLTSENLTHATLPKDLSAQQWADLFTLTTTRPTRKQANR